MANAHNADQSGDTRILSGTIWRGAAYIHSHSSVPHTIENSGVRCVGQPSPLLRKHGLPVYRGNGQPASTRSSAAPTWHGRVWSVQQSLLIQNNGLFAHRLTHQWSSPSYSAVQSMWVYCGWTDQVGFLCEHYHRAQLPCIIRVQVCS